MEAAYETREIHVDKEGMDIYGVIHIPSGTEGKMPTVIMSHELGATLDRVKGYGEALAEEGYVTVCFDFCGGGWASRSDGELLDMSVLTEKADLEAVLEEVKQWDFVDVWDQESYERIKEYGKNILLIHGDRDSIVPISYSDKLAETIDHVEYHVIRGADHGYLGADFDLAVSYIRDFLKAEPAAK